jgi:hypothetical protein
MHDSPVHGEREEARVPAQKEKRAGEMPAHWYPKDEAA